MSSDLFLSVVALSIGAFLTISDLASCERAKLFSRYAIEWLWDVAGSKILENTPLWNITVNHFLENGLRGKAIISQIVALKRCVTLSKRLEPSVVRTSFCSVKATPMFTPHQDDLQYDESADTIQMYSAKQGRTGVAVTVGANIGQPLIIGMQFAAATPLDDSLCVGIEAVGCIGSGRLVSISFAPFSGTCFIENECGVAIQTSALPSVREASEGCAWIHVTEKGGIRFLRQINDGKVEDTGLLPPQMLPDWIQSFFGCIDFGLSYLAAAVDVSVEYFGCEFPTDMSIFNKHVVEIQTTWSLHASSSSQFHASQLQAI